MIVVPFGGDQIENAGRVERLRVGVALRADAFEAEAVRAALARVHGEACRLRARAIATALNRIDGAAGAVAAIVALLATSR
jgi:UDP:flavonoid glycosyltransferase YjiC (YdhE family)